MIIKILSTALAGLVLSTAVTAAPWIERVTPAGITVWIASDPSAKETALQVAWRGGSDSDPISPVRLSSSATALLTEGAGDLDPVAYAGALEDIGAELGFAADRDYIQGQLTVPADALDHAADLMRLALINPRLVPADMERLRRTFKAELPDIWTQPGFLASVAFNQLMLPDHPHTKSILRPDADPPRLSPDMVRNWAKARLARDNMVVSIAGRVSEQEALSITDRIFSQLPAKSDRPKPPPRHYTGAGQTVIVPREGDQTLIAISQPVPNGDDDAGIAADLLSDILGDDATSRLFKAIREQRGLSYGIEASIQPSEEAAVLVVATSIPNDKAGEVLNLIRTEMDRLAKDGVTADELNALRARRRAAHGRDLSSPAAIVSEMTFNRLRRRDVGYFSRQPDRDDAVPLSVINKVAQDFFSTARSTTVLVGTPSNMDKTARLVLP